MIDTNSGDFSEPAVSGRLGGGGKLLKGFHWPNSKTGGTADVMVAASFGKDAITRRGSAVTETPAKGFFTMFWILRGLPGDSPLSH